MSKAQCFPLATFNACFMSAARAPEVMHDISVAAGGKAVVCLQEVDSWIPGQVDTEAWGSWQIIKNTQHARAPALAIPSEAFVGCKAEHVEGFYNSAFVSGHCSYIASYMPDRSKPVHIFKVLAMN